MSVSLILGMNVHAQETVATSTRAMSTSTDHSQMTMPETRAEERREIRENRRGMLTENIQNRIINLGQNVTLRLASAIKRFENIIARIDSRIVKLKAEGFDTTSAESKLIEAKSSLTDTKNILNSIGSVRNAISGETPRDSFQIIRAQLIAVRDGLKNTHALLRETIPLLKSDNAQNVTETVEETSTSTLPE